MQKIDWTKMFSELYDVRLLSLIWSRFSSVEAKGEWAILEFFERLFEDSAFSKKFLICTLQVLYWKAVQHAEDKNLSKFYFWLFNRARMIITESWEIETLNQYATT